MIFVPKKVSFSLPFSIGSNELEKLRQDLKQYANALAEIAGVEESQEEYEGW